MQCIMPPHILDHLLKSEDPELRDIALTNLLTNGRLGGERKVQALTFAGGSGGSMRTVYDCKKRPSRTQAKVARTEGSTESKDGSVNQAFDGLGQTRDFYKEVLRRNSIDDRGMRLEAFVHFDKDYNNAYWDGRVMVFGDGDGKLFVDFTKSLDVIAHELTHGVTEFTAGLEYHNESGALNESISDVFGSLVKQWTLKHTAEQADWLIGSDVFTPKIKADALRSMKAPGTAYDNLDIGKDPQPDHMDRFVKSPDTLRGDWGGVHINSGIPNKAFYLTAVAIGGHAWEAAGHIWYEALLASNATTNFRQFAQTTVLKAGQLYGSAKRKAVSDAWSQVGISVTVPSSLSATAKGEAAELESAEIHLAELTQHIEVLSDRVRELTSEVEHSLQD
jgi:Zn-dependent metalloprotease